MRRDAPNAGVKNRPAGTPVAKVTSLCPAASMGGPNTRFMRFAGQTCNNFVVSAVISRMSRFREARRTNGIVTQNLTKVYIIPYTPTWLVRLGPYRNCCPRDDRDAELKAELHESSSTCC